VWGGVVGGGGGVKLSGCKGGHSTASVVEVKNVNVTTLTLILMARCKGA